MQSKVFISLLALSGAAMVSASAVRRGNTKLNVITGERVYQTIIKESPFMVLTTTTFTWTQSPSITVPASTVAPSPTLIS
ncbi:hypothetical protein D9613_010327 [Agrocybe pediades]|uniref:Uncharacterized protein n=1 Tax=Agrocybe pediades TaxID=84607 RepID=A0A8H4VJJ5_9AGAR|nr:hypothetical protein D9613_010327 [Agrocybe pediades]KAF9559430.1 hypothetical protein CPC08DRAFT_708833 [Agrocybe pediades]